MLLLLYTLHKSLEDTLIFTSRCLVAASNDGRWVPELPASHSSQPLNPSGHLTNSLKIHSYVTAADQSASLSWCQAPVCLTFAGLLM
jgi:hypothetical protein